MNTEAVKTEIVEKNGAKYLKVTMGGRDFFLEFKFLGGKNVAFLDISGQFVLIEYAADQLVKKLDEAGVEFDTILNPVSKSNALAHAVAVRWAKLHNTDMTHTVVARKSSDPSNPVRASYRSVTTPTEQILSLTPDDAAYIKGKKVLLMDDVFGGGGPTKALRALVASADAQMAAHAVVAVEQGASFPEDLFYLFELPTID